MSSQKMCLHGKSPLCIWEGARKREAAGATPRKVLEMRDQKEDDAGSACLLRMTWKPNHTSGNRRCGEMCLQPVLEPGEGAVSAQVNPSHPK